MSLLKAQTPVQVQATDDEGVKQKRARFHRGGSPGRLGEGRFQRR